MAKTVNPDNAARRPSGAVGRFPGLAAAMLAAVLASGPALGGTPALWGTTETMSTNVVAFKQWNAMFERFAGQNTDVENPCAGTIFQRCLRPDWRDLVAGLQGKSRRAQVDEVNARMNRARYITDPTNYGLPDYWATPKEFFMRDGDCEDYALAKYLTLAALGWGDEEMRLVVLRDLNLQIDHAVLVVYLDDRALILDNQIRQVVNAESIRHYRPYYSINRLGWWLHKGFAF